MWEGSKRRKSISLCKIAGEIIWFIWVLFCCFVCLLYMLMSEKQGSTMFLKYCEVIYARVLFKIWERFSEETGVSGCCFLEFPTSNPMLLYEGRELRDSWNSTPPRSPFQESEILHHDFRYWAINTNLTKSTSNKLVLYWTVVEHSHKPQLPALPYCCMSCLGREPASPQPLRGESKGMERRSGWGLGILVLV